MLKNRETKQPELVDTMTPEFEEETQTKKVKCKNCNNEFVVSTRGRRFVFPEDVVCKKCGRKIGQD